MAGEALGDKLGRLVGESFQRATSGGLLARARAARGRGASRRQPEDASAVSDSSLPSGDAPETVDINLTDALARAEAAEAQVVRLRAELMRKEEVLYEARNALRTARLALRDQLRITEE
jgi:hypothetical protein